jgi:hypothetical protein
MSPDERQCSASELLKIADVFRDWAEILNGSQPEATSTPAEDLALVESGTGETLPEEEPVSPMSQQGSVEHVEAEGSPVAVSANIGDLDGAR